MKTRIQDVKAFTLDLPWDELREAFLALTQAGEKPTQAARAVAIALDESLDWTELVQGPTGIILEAIDRPLLIIVVTVILLFTKRGNK